MTLFAYLASFLFADEATVYRWLPALLQLTSFPPVIAVQILLIIPGAHHIAVAINVVASCLLPHYGVIGASMFMQQQYAENQILALVGQPTKSYFANEQVQVVLGCYACMIPVYLCALVLLDRLQHRSSGVAGAAPPALEHARDEDVAAEEAAVAASQGAAGAVWTQGLGKAYLGGGGCCRKGPKKAAVVAVKAVSIQVAKGEVLGLLGPNGAGLDEGLLSLSLSNSLLCGESL